MLWNQESAAKATGGKVFGFWDANRVCIDTRKIQPKDLFIAFKGEKVDGHEYVAEALAKGAGAAMVEYMPADVDPSRLLLVKDCSKALENLAIYNRQRLQAKVIAVTGSVGKTSTKEALHVAFSALGKTYTSQGNYNNHLGLPISMASIPTSSEYVIFEMGMSNPGEILYLTKLANPDIAIITNIAGVHLANFNSEEDVAKAKSEIFAGLNKSGVVILNKESKYFSTQIAEATRYNVHNIITVGEGGDSYLVDCQAIDNGMLVKAKIINDQIEYKLSSHGVHHAYNSIAVLSAVKFFGGDLKAAANNLIHFQNVKGRGEVSKIQIGNKNITLIDDSYNASPMSVRAALHSVGTSFDKAKRRVLILADMFELGPNEIQEHKGLCSDITNNNIDKVIAIGVLVQYLYDALPENVKLASFTNVTDAFSKILDLIQDQDVVLVKGSNGTKVHKLIDYFKEQQ
ncbi:MAG: UDP-N-acetylmuramoyl-tripeptide--D-alanyl-D-alanine ligase [Alphaproteobacteria bacterium]